MRFGRPRDRVREQVWIRIGGEETAPPPTPTEDEWVERGTDLDDFVFHELRHTAAALAIATGAHPLTIKERLGHSNIAVTMDLYAHRYPNQDAALV